MPATAAGGVARRSQKAADATARQGGVDESGDSRCTHFTLSPPDDRAAGGEPARQGRGGEAPRRRPDADPDHEAAARLAGRTLVDLAQGRGPRRHRAARAARSSIGAMTRHVDVADLAGGAGGHPGARRARRHDRRSGGAPPRHHRRLDRQQRSERRLSGRLPRRSAPPSSPTSASIAADEFFKGLFETALEPDEIITKVQLPDRRRRRPTRSSATRPRATRWSACSSPSAASEIRVAVTGAGANGVFRVPAFEEALKKRFAPKSLEGLTIPADGMQRDIHGSAEYRAHLVGVMARRAVAAARERTSTGLAEGSRPNRHSRPVPGIHGRCAALSAPRKAGIKLADDE